MHVQRLTHLGICVSDLERSLRFYRDLLGCKEVGRLELEGGPVATLNGLPEVKVRAIYLERDGWTSTRSARSSRPRGAAYCPRRASECRAARRA